MKPPFYLVSALMPRPDAAPDMQLRAMRRHADLVAPLIERHGGVLEKETSDRLLARFPDPVHAVLCAVRIQQAHRQEDAAPRPPAVRVVVFGSEFDGPLEEVLLWSAEWISSTGAGEIQIAQSVAVPWGNRGNRELIPLPRDAARRAFPVFLVRWQGPSREPLQTVRRRGWLVVALVVLPALVLLAFSWLQEPPFTLPEEDVLLLGPIWVDSESILCPDFHPRGWRVLADPALISPAPNLWRRGHMKRLTGMMLSGEEKTLRIDVVDEISGLTEARMEIPCPGEPCSCLQPPQNGAMPDESLRKPLEDSCRTLLTQAKIPQAAVEACVAEYMGQSPGGNPP